jgi:2-keto-4-pentenoate hydratase/2-oxohepta-3-ene-1,7-dioic acid hydratase in catechol pathway
MKLAMRKEKPAPLAIIGDEVLDLPAFAGPGSFRPASITHIVAGGDDALDAVRAMVGKVEGRSDSENDRLRETGVLAPLDGTVMTAPFPSPALLFFTGGNYRAHIDEVSKRTGMKIEPPKTPIGFIKNSHTVIGPGDAIVLPAQHPDMIDFEIEFAFVVGRPCHNIREDEAADCIAGYTLVNDISARDWNESAKRDDGTLDLTMPTFGKQFPTFTPMGPTFVTADEIPDPYDVALCLKLNGEVMQDAKTDDLLFGFGRILSYFSGFFSFRPGDVITTGSPPGVGFARDPAVFLRPGDEVEISASGIGSMTNPVVAG